MKGVCGIGAEAATTDMLKDLSIEEGRSGGQRRGNRGEPMSYSAANTNAKVAAHDSESRSYEISAQDRKELRSDTINYDAQRMIGHGSFGAVFLAKVAETEEIVAIKKVLQDRRFKNRELQIMKQLSKETHPYVVLLKHHFISKGSKNDDVYLNLVLEYVPETIYSMSKHFNRAKESFPIPLARIFMYQLARALGHIHGLGICHRDIKPQNLLVDPAKFVLKLCDFGSAKALVQGEPNIAYICSRYYRAPELIFGSTDYTTAVDVWSHGCVMAELMLGSPIFPGCSGVDQLVEIIKLLGSPTKDELKSMNPNYLEFKFPQIRGHPWASIFKPGTPSDAVDLAKWMLTYDPVKRCRAIEACSHPFFNELRVPGALQPDLSPLPLCMFQFTEEEVALMPEMRAVLTPPHLAAALEGKAGIWIGPPPSSAPAALEAQTPVSSGLSIDGVAVISVDKPGGRHHQAPGNALSAPGMTEASSQGGVVKNISSLNLSEDALDNLTIATAPSAAVVGNTNDMFQAPDKAA